MAKSMKGISIRSARSRKTQHQEIVELAFEKWLARLGELDGSPEDDFYWALREVLVRHSRLRGTTAKLFVMDKSGDENERLSKK